jgi:hypothetical protein
MVLRRLVMLLYRHHHLDGFNGNGSSNRHPFPELDERDVRPDSLKWIEMLVRSVLCHDWSLFHFHIFIINVMGKTFVDKSSLNI